jgi:hypothetical protein
MCHVMKNGCIMCGGTISIKMELCSRATVGKMCTKIPGSSETNALPLAVDPATGMMYVDIDATMKVVEVWNRHMSCP